MQEVEKVVEKVEQIKSLEDEWNKNKKKKKKKKRKRKKKKRKKNN